MLFIQHTLFKHYRPSLIVRRFHLQQEKGDSRNKTTEKYITATEKKHESNYYMAYGAYPAPPLSPPAPRPL